MWPAADRHSSGNGVSWFAAERVCGQKDGSMERTSAGKAAVWRAREAGIPGIPWGRCWLLAVVLAGLFVELEERYWRGQGFRPNVKNTVELWSYWRNRARRSDGRAVVVLGTSRLQSNICLDTVRRRFPGHTVCQLALSSGWGAIGLLEDLAEDPMFRGTVICEFYTLMLDPRWRDLHSEYRDHQPDWKVCDAVRVAKAWLPGHRAVFTNQLGFRQLLEFWAIGRVERPIARISMAFDRQSCWDFSRVQDRDALKANSLRQYEAQYEEHGDVPDWEVLAKQLSEVERMIARIREKGGDVAFVRPVTTDRLWELEQKQAPRAEHWDRFAAATSAVTLHCRDIPELSALDYPDSGHLGGQDASVFTRVLLRELQARGLRWKN